ncbi:MAG: EAL domain-containing protein, partial [Myxococcota bacterium]
PDDPIGFHNHAVYLEITESAAFEHRELCERVLREVCSRTGAKMVIDDFGQGYSNLHRIIALEPEVVKLDMSLVRNLHRDKRKQTIVKHAVKMCVEAGAKVVAEGIETPRELQACQEAGAHYGQGYLFARPSFPPRNIRWPARAGGSTPAPGRLQRPKFKIKT